MLPSSRLFLTVLVALLLLLTHAPPVLAQEDSGTLELKAILVAGDLSLRPVPKQVFAVQPSDGETLEITTGFDGQATMELPTGRYTLSSIAPVSFEDQTQVIGRAVKADGGAVSGGSVIAFGLVTARTAVDGTFRLEIVPTGLGPLTVFARLIEAGRVTDPSGQPVVNLPVRVTTSFGGFPSRYPRTNTDDVYRVDGIPVGSITVFASDGRRQLEGQSEGVLASEGDELVLDIRLDGDQVLARLFDANNHVYPVQFPSGSLVQGTLGVFRVSEDDRHGALQLEFGGGGAFRRFVAQSSFLDLDGREVVLTGSNASGLEVVRKVFVPADGYFVRYLEVSPVTTLLVRRRDLEEMRTLAELVLAKDDGLWRRPRLGDSRPPGERMAGILRRKAVFPYTGVGGAPS